MIKCKECGYTFSNLTPSHLKFEHGITPEEYYRKYPETSRICAKCGIEKSISEFYNLKQNTIKKQYSCKKCEGMRSIQKRLRNKTKVISHYTNGKMICQCCGFKGSVLFLTIDHKNGRPLPRTYKNGNTRMSNFYSWIIHNKFPKNLQVLCWNCNGAKRNYRNCPHELLKQGLTEDQIIYKLTQKKSN